MLTYDVRRKHAYTLSSSVSLKAQVSYKGFKQPEKTQVMELIDLSILSHPLERITGRMIMSAQMAIIRWDKNRSPEKKHLTTCKQNLACPIVPSGGGGGGVRGPHLLFTQELDVIVFLFFLGLLLQFCTNRLCSVAQIISG